MGDGSWVERAARYRRLICPNAPEQQEGESEQAVGLEECAPNVSCGMSVLERTNAVFPRRVPCKEDVFWLLGKQPLGPQEPRKAS